MAEHLRDATKKMDFISREAAVEALRPYKIDPFKIGFLDDNIDGFSDGIDTAISKLSVMPAADVVSRDCYDRILAENDTMREMLAQIGKKPGDKMDDVRSVARGEWIETDYYDQHYQQIYECSHCHREVADNFIANHLFCLHCGADMKETGR